ncbi:MAG: hypothetical protein ACR2P1_18950 [Pseudomonadales bacterium]
MSFLGHLLSPRLRLIQQEQQIKQLQKELAALRAQNDNMREGMRRCLSCEYRIDFKRRQHTASGTVKVDGG